MDKEKQIEEMVRDIETGAKLCRSHTSCDECKFDRYDNCKSTMIATILINECGYRKTSEVAREIFEEVGELTNEYLEGKIYTHDFCINLAELKKKYTEEGK